MTPRSRRWNGNDLDTYADDLATLVKMLDLKNAIHFLCAKSSRTFSSRPCSRGPTGRVSSWSLTVRDTEMEELLDTR
jgi:hypothetical protein